MEPERNLGKLLHFAEPVQARDRRADDQRLADAQLVDRFQGLRRFPEPRFVGE